MDKYRTGYITEGDTRLATIYEVPASVEIADRLRMDHDMLHPPIWQVRSTSDTMEIYYYAQADRFKYSVIKKAEGNLYDIALEDIRKTIGTKKKKAA